MKLKASGSNGEIDADKFNVSTSGVLTATDAILNTMTANTATVKNNLYVAAGTGTGNEGNLNVTGKTTIDGDTIIRGKAEVHGRLWLKGNVYINTGNADGTGGQSSSAGKLIIKATTEIDSIINILGENSTTSIYAGGLGNGTSGLIIKGTNTQIDTNYIRIGHDGDNSSTIEMKGELLCKTKSTIEGDFTYKGNIYCMNGEEPALGYTGEAHIKSTFKSGTLQFVKGILVGSTGDIILGENTSVDIDTGFLPAVTKDDKGKILAVNADGGIYWASGPLVTGTSGTVWGSLYQTSSSGNVNGWYPPA
jgi:hypothetical protein